MKNPMLIRIKGLRLLRHKRYPCLMALTKAETKMLLEDQKRKIRLRNELSSNKDHTI